MALENTAWYYHEDRPHGRIFNMNDHDEEVLASQGWVDTPAKLGIHPNGGDTETFAQLRQDVIEGKVPRIGDYEVREDDKAKETVLKQNDVLLRKLAREKEEILTLQQKLKMKDEELADMRSDVAKLKAKPRQASRRSGNAEDKPVRGTKQKPPAPVADDSETEL